MTGRNDIHEDDFPDHVKQMHQERDHKFELEYKVSLSHENFHSIVVYDIG